MQHANVRFGSPLAHDRTPTVDQEDNDSEFDEDKDDQGESASVTLVIYSHSSTLGAAYLSPPAQGAVLHVLADCQDSSSFDTAGLVLDQVEPDVVVVNAGAADELVGVLQAHCNQSDCKLEIRPDSEFNSTHETSPANSARDSYGRPAGGAWSGQGSMEGEEDEDEVLKEVRLAGMMDLSLQFSVCAAGGLIGYLAKVRARGELKGLDDQGGLRVGGIETLTLREYMHISADSLSALGVFSYESHAYTHASTPQKQGLSLSALLSTTCTPSGAALLRAWLLRPLAGLADIRARHDAVECLSKPGNAAVVGGLRGALKGIKNVKRILASRFRKGVAEARDWRALLEFCFKMVQVRNGMEELIGIQRNGLVHKLAFKISADLLVQLGQTINETIDWDESRAQGRVCCKSGIDDALDELKTTYAGLDSLLMTVADRLAPTLPPDVVKALNVTYFPQLGFLLAVELSKPWDEFDPEEEVLEGCEFQFFTDEITYFKNEHMRDLDAHFGDIHSSIVDCEIEIVHKLSENVLACESDLLAAVDACAELDCLMAFATAAGNWGWTRPKMTEENVLEIAKGRHPLLDVVLDDFVPNSTLLYGAHGLFSNDDDVDKASSGGDPAAEEEKKSVMVLTGSNASGKSVYGKTAALITYMAHIGCFVPADAARIGLTDKIFTRLSTRESVSKLQSSFTIDLNQISYALRNSTARSLLIIDEFGKGTISTDGAGLLAGTIVHLLKRGKECPKAIVMTHFHELFKSGVMPPDLPLSYASMEVVINSQSDDHSASNPITYLYRLAPGLSLESHAASCARSQGIPQEVVDRAVEVGAYLSRFEYLPLQDRKLSTEEVEQLTHAERCVRAFLAKDYSPGSLDAKDARDLKHELREMLGDEDE